jgi:LacI family transcriptional regulator
VDRILEARITAGLVAITPGLLAARLTQLHDQGFPVVLIDDQGLPTGVPWVGADNRSGAYQAVRHLITLGHRRIAHIKGPASYQCSQERYQGYCQALMESGLPLDAALVVQGDFEMMSGQVAAHTLLSRAERPTAIFAANDHMAWGVLEVAEEWGLRVPEEVAALPSDGPACGGTPAGAIRITASSFALSCNESLSKIFPLPHYLYRAYTRAAGDQAGRA